MDNIKNLTKEVENLIKEVESLKVNEEFKKAMELLENNLSTYNDDYRLYEEIADIYLYEWKHSKALKAVNFALSINPESATWCYLKWFILLAKEKIKEAIPFLEKSNTLMPNNSEVLRNLWWAYSMSSEKERWIFILKRALFMCPWDLLISQDLAMAMISAWMISEWNELLKKIWKQEMSI